MKTVLVINPNTTASMLEGVLSLARSVLPGGVAVHGVSAQRGVAVVSTHASYVIASQSVLETWAHWRSAQMRQAPSAREDPAAIVVACFGDPGVLALRELTDIPVYGLAEASLRYAAQTFGSAAIVTSGLPWKPMLAELIHQRGLSGAHKGTFAIDSTGLAATTDRARFTAAMQGAIDQAQESGAQSIVLGGAALAGLASEFRSRLALLDCVHCTFKAIATQLESPQIHHPAAPQAVPPPIASAGLTEELASLILRPRGG